MKESLDDTATHTSVCHPSLMEIHMVSGRGEVDGWVHTHGLSALGLPELEIRGVRPNFLMRAAAHALNDIADYLFNSGDVVELGEPLELGANTFVRLAELAPLEGHEEHYADRRWAVVGLPSVCPACECERAAGKGEALN